MRTTLDLPDELFRQVKAKAAIKGTTIKELLTRYIETGLRQTDLLPHASRKRSTLPIIKRRGKIAIPNVTSESQARLDEEADRAKLHRSFRR